MSKDKTVEKKYLIGGADVGTGTLLFAKMNENKVEVNKMRDMFIYILDNQISAAEMANSKLDYITQYEDSNDEEVDDTKREIEFHAVIGEDALKMANIFNSKINRPMAKGMLSPSEMHAAPIISAMFKTIISEKVEGGQVVFSVPSQPCDIDEVAPVHFHQEMFKNIFKDIGFDEAIPLNEAHSIIFSECSKENFTGIGISFGSGQVNVCLSYKGTLILSFSVGRSGDWIDEYAGNASGILPNKITTIKEKSDMSIKKPVLSNTHKKEKIARQAIAFAYEQLIEYVVEHIDEQFKANADNIDFDEDEIPIVIAGGTSLISGFVNIFKEKFNNLKDFPISISEIRHAQNPLETVSVGCLIYSQWLHNKKEN